MSVNPRLIIDQSRKPENEFRKHNKEKESHCLKKKKWNCWTADHANAEFRRRNSLQVEERVSEVRSQEGHLHIDHAYECKTNGCSRIIGSLVRAWLGEPALINNHGKGLLHFYLPCATPVPVGNKFLNIP